MARNSKTYFLILAAFVLFLGFVFFTIKYQNAHYSPDEQRKNGGAITSEKRDLAMQFSLGISALARRANMI